MASSFLHSANLAGLCGEKPVCAPGRTCGAFASCGTSEARRRGPMSELSDAGGFGSRQARRGAAHGEERSPTSASEKASDKARRRESAMDGAGEPACGAGESEEVRDGAPSALENAKRGHVRGRSGTEPSRLRRVAQDCDPKTYLRMSSGRKDARIAKARRRVPLPRTWPHFDKAKAAWRKTGEQAVARRARLPRS